LAIVFRLEAPYRGEYHLHRLSFGQGSPRVAVVAGVHGNEVNGVYAVNIVAGVLRVCNLRGTVHLLPCVNAPGAAEGRKRWPFDDRDLERAFPGAADGLGVERVAHAVLEHTDADVCVDVHSGSSVIHELPHARAPLGGPELHHARATGLPVVWRRAAERQEQGLRGAWRRLGRPCIQVRGGRGSALDAADARAMARGLVRLLVDLGVVASGDPPGTILETDTVEDARAGAGGLFVPEVRPGDRVAADALLGIVRSPMGGEPIEEVRAERPGVVLAVRTYPMVHAQELLVRVAVEKP
jgi:hypothetical protein